MRNLILKAARPAFGGLFIGRHEGKVVMIKGALLPDETVEVTIDDEKKDYITASVRKIIEPSPHRIEPACKHFGSCGGCHFQHIPYNLQIQIKEEILMDCLKRLAKIETALSAPLINNNPWNYRLRGQFKACRGKAGFYRENSREIVDIDNCPLMVKEINESFRKAKYLLKGINIREIHITAGDSLIALIKAPGFKKSAAQWNRLASGFLDSGFSGLFVEMKNKKLLRYGDRYTVLPLADLKYTISPMSFFQSNWGLNRRVVSFIKNNLQPLKGKKVLDLYSGAGNFSIPAAGTEVTAVEGNPFAIEDGKRNLEINNISNCRFIRSPAADFHSEDRFDIVILDPPRAGLSNKGMDKVLTLMPERIVYISCNPSTFARDLRRLTAKYGIESIRMINFFPQTYHIESLAFLNLR
ncbi:MAG TPA: class I SAM-dependent RNA methyltransferase [Nitrospirae bacterium]|nr:23S rRNA (uracil(1939)-C(5))-methyltransferase RlmD [bacterium BMS3Abin06]HDH12087.1 class I SAM-dependent RNA methyltransferase [Nitrospirota bacterium]HDZ01223.1 class I SAM-dependent RNA methyltransferase [Nitrospirota bacterium]